MTSGSTLILRELLADKSNFMMDESNYMTEVHIPAFEELSCYVEDYFASFEASI